MKGGKIPLDPNSTKKEMVSERSAKFMKECAHSNALHTLSCLQCPNNHDERFSVDVPVSFAKTSAFMETCCPMMMC